jgi:hypothetical protein
MYMRPTFFAMPEVIRPARVADFQLDGTWIALFLVEVGIGPDPLCPFFLLAISQRNRAWVASLTLGYIHSLDPSAARTLAPWFALKRTDVVKFPREKLPSVSLNKREFCSQTPISKRSLTNPMLGDRVHSPTR